MSLAGLGGQQAGQAEQEYNYALALNSMTAPELASYTNYLNEMTSADPTQRLAAAAPEVQQIGEQTQQAVNNTANLPRGGANAALTAQAYQTEATNVGNALDTAYTQAQQELGQLGEFGVRGQRQGLVPQTLDWEKRRRALAAQPG